MRKFLIYALTTLEVLGKWVFALFFGTICVLSPVLLPVAVGFIAVTASTLVSDPYLKVIVSAGAAIGAMWLVLNAAELAILLTSWRIKKLVDRYVFHLERQIDSCGTAPIFIPGEIG